MATSASSRRAAMPRILKTLVLVLTLMTLRVPVALAGTITVHDSAGFVPSGDIEKLRTDANDWPFDVHILAQNVASLDMLEENAHLAVTGPNVLVIAIDPAHHKTVVRFGNSTGIKPGDYDSISAAGNAHFRAHNIAQGFEVILARARASRESVSALSTSTTPVVITNERGLSWSAWLGIVLLFTGFVTVIVLLYRRSKRNQEAFQAALDENRLETSELRSRNIEEMTMPNAARPVVFPSTVRTSMPLRSDGSAIPPTYAPTAFAPSPSPIVQQTTVVQPSNNDGLLTGILLGESLAQSSRRDRVIEHEVIVEREVEHHRSDRSDDAGGSSSSYQPASSWEAPSTTSHDSGGSSSSWNDSNSSSYDSSGSSGDSGGGGSDGGGGSSDW
jgi:hypothetical protein